MRNPPSSGRQNNELQCYSIKTRSGKEKGVGRRKEAGLTETRSHRIFCAEGLRCDPKSDEKQLEKFK